ncbi:PREDICTED: dual serine/threonine and tyrosine protein kinase-like [Priapulus caudatus]|uniref:Dual serine/threonine and tyrosine protein kinase-like n=1 Tax=Priapulus caudatus TaxID=37621 RepID=A0ABM1EWN0_PRICU|nr:PREDICTED: dual serine/threonine and tyrosine protein kinase-like [Priapulus caudatus]
MAQLYTQCTEEVLPIVIYAIGQEELSPSDIIELQDLRNIAPDVPVLFVCSGPSDLAESDQHAAVAVPTTKPGWTRPGRRDHRKAVRTSLWLFEQLCDVGYLTRLPTEAKRVWRHSGAALEAESEFVESFHAFRQQVIFYVHHVLQQYLTQAATILKNAHTRCLKMFILTAFDMARDMIITPKRIDYARQREGALYDSLLALATLKQEEIRIVVTDTINNLQEPLLTEAVAHTFRSVVVPESGEISSSRDVQACTHEIQHLVLSRLNREIAGQITGSVEYLRENYTGTLRRCLESLEERGDKENYDCPSAEPRAPADS